MKAEITESELMVLRCLWEEGESSSAQVAELVYDEVSDPKRASAQKLLDRLVWKGLAEQDRTRRPRLYRAVVSRDEFAGRRVQALADKLYDGSISPVLTSLVQSKQVSRKQLAEIRALIDRLAPPKTRRSPRRDK